MKKDHKLVMILNGAYRPINIKLKHIIGLQETYFLSELINLENIHGEDFFYSRKKVEMYFQLKEYSLRTIESKLQALKLIKVKRKGFPSKNYYKVNYKNIDLLINRTKQYLDKLDQSVYIKEVHQNYKVYQKTIATVPEISQSLKNQGTSYINKLIYSYKDKIDYSNLLLLLKIKNFKESSTSLKELKNNRTENLEVEKIEVKKKYPKIVQQKEKPKKEKPKVEPKYSITTQDYLAYNTLIGLGARKHNPGNKAEAETLDLIHQLLSPRCKNPYIPFYKKKDYSAYKLFDKVWTLDDLVESYNYHLANNGKVIKSISEFILTKYGVKVPFSPLLNNYREIQKKKEEYKSFNGTAKRIMDFIDQKTGRAKEFHPVLYQRTGHLVDSLTNRFSGNPNLLAPEDDLPYQFLQYLDEKLNKQNFKVPYMCSEQFVNEFAMDAQSKGKIVETRNLRH